MRTFAERCEKTDMVKTGCAHCRGHKLPEEEQIANPVETRGFAFEAYFPGRCMRCERGYSEGDLIIRAWLDGQHSYAHKECPS